MSAADAWAAQIQSMSPAARQEREWNEYTRKAEAQLFAAKIAKAQRESEQAEKRQKEMDRYDQLKTMAGDIETFRERMLTEGIMSEAEKMDRVSEWSEKYSDPQLQQLFVRGIQGDYGAIYDTLDAADQDLVRKGFLEPKDVEERKLRVTKDGKVARIGKNSRLYAGELTESEIDAVEILGRDSYGTPEFNDLVKRMGVSDLKSEEADTKDAEARAKLNEANAKRIDAELKASNGISAKTLTPAQKKVDETFANEYVDWSKGGMADVEKNLSQLLDVNRALASGDNLTGGYIGLTPDKLLGYMSPYRS